MLLPFLYREFSMSRSSDSVMAITKVAGMASAAAINAFSTDKFVRADDPAVEPEVPDETALQAQIRQIVSRVQGHNFSLHGHGMRATHVKTQAIVKGTFTVASDLPEHLAQGICGAANSRQTHPLLPFGLPMTLPSCRMIALRVRGDVT